MFTDASASCEWLQTCKPNGTMTSERAVSFWRTVAWHVNVVIEYLPAYCIQWNRNITHFLIALRASWSLCDSRAWKHVTFAFPSPASLWNVPAEKFWHLSLCRFFHSHFKWRRLLKAFAIEIRPRHIQSWSNLPAEHWSWERFSRFSKLFSKIRCVLFNFPLSKTELLICGKVNCIESKHYHLFHPGKDTLGCLFTIRPPSCASHDCFGVAGRKQGDYGTRQVFFTNKKMSMIWKISLISNSRFLPFIPSQVWTSCTNLGGMRGDFHWLK